MTSVLTRPGPAGGEGPAERTPSPRRYLMCRPERFAVGYAINPWMRPELPVDRDRALAQWDALRRAYLDLGHRAGFRTDARAHAEAAAVLGLPVVPLELVDPRYYHLDTALAVLDDRPGRVAIAWCPGAFTPAAQAVLRERYPDAVVASAADAAVLGLNAVSDGRHVVLPAAATGLAAAFAARGFVPVPVDLSELLLGGGGPKCCTLEVRA